MRPLLILLCGFVLVGGASARTFADPPPANDARTAAEVIPSFPAAVPGTTVGATVDRLDPQRSQCGTVEGTVWYRINQAPDGTIALNVHGAGLAPVVRVYNLVKNGIVELDCASAKKGGTAAVSWETKRGVSYLILVGKRTGAADAGFTLNAKLYLPPPNDTAREAQHVAIPGQVSATTLGATSDDSDPEGCGLSAGTVWYSLDPGALSRVVLRLHAEGGLDASAVVRRRIRSQTETLGCRATDRKGDATLAWDVEQGATYLVAIGQREGSPPGDFRFRTLAAQPPERAPGHRLPTGGVHSSVYWLTDVNDIWWTTFTPGTTYRIAFASKGCPRLTLRSRYGGLRSISCRGYTNFTPGPDGGGRYIFEVTAPEQTGPVGYRLEVAQARPDDIGVGIEIGNLQTVHGTLAPTGVDAVDIYNFDVGQLSDVRVRLGRQAGRSFTITLLTDQGRNLGSSDTQVRRRLAAGQYLVAVRGAEGSRSGSYTLGLVIRQVTVTTLSVASPLIAPGAAAVFAIGVSPTPSGGWIQLQIDRFDPLDGWQYNRRIRVHAPGGSLSWTPPTQGRWRARAQFLGTIQDSPSRSGYALVRVARPVG